MLLVTHCKSCKKDIKIKSKATTRPDLQMERGDTFDVRCEHCGTLDKKHVNDVKAVQSKTIMLAGLGLALIVTVVLWNFYGAISTLTIIIPLIIWQQQMAATRTFNSYMIRRK